MNTKNENIIKLYSLKISGELVTPFEHYNQFEFNLGYDDTDRKSIKAHITYPKGESGIVFDYFYKKWYNFNFEADIDLPLPELKVTAFKLGHQLTEDSYGLSFGGEWMQNDLNFESKFKFDGVSSLLGMISHKKSLFTIFGHKHKIKNFIKKFSSFHFGLYLE